MQVKPGFDLEAVDREKGIMLTLPKHLGKPPSENYMRKTILIKGYIFSILSLAKVFFHLVIISSLIKFYLFSLYIIIIYFVLFPLI